MKAISIRQPWAWLIVNGYKDIENRSWNTKYRGPVLIHASATKPSMEDRSAVIEILLNHRMYHIDFPSWNDFAVPENWQGHTGIERGGIVGIATITDCVDSSPSPWFFGPKGFTLTDAKPLPFCQLKGKLSFFEALTPFDMGYQAAYAGLSYAENPFVSGDNVTLPHSDDWQQGYITARDAR